MSLFQKTMDTLITLTQNPKLVQQLQDAAQSAVRAWTADLQEEARNTNTKARFDATYPLSVTARLLDIVPEIKTTECCAFQPFMEPSLKDYQYKTPFPDRVSVRLGDYTDYDYPSGSMFSSISVRFQSNGLMYVFTAEVDGDERVLSTLRVALSVLDKEPNEYGFYGHKEHSVTAKSELSWRDGKVFYNNVQPFLADTLKAFSQKMNNESFEHILDAISNEFNGRMSPDYSPSPPPRKKRAHSYE